MYYLQSRYYNPEVVRFINADVYIDHMKGINVTNMFAYCDNVYKMQKAFIGLFNLRIGLINGKFTINYKILKLMDRVKL